MKCGMCGKEMDSAFSWIGGVPIGPTCHKRAFGKQYTLRHGVVRNEQVGLFDEEPNEEETTPRLPERECTGERIPKSQTSFAW